MLFVGKAGPVEAMKCVYDFKMVHQSETHMKKHITQHGNVEKVNM